MLENYKNTYWTRLVAVGVEELGQELKWPLGPDIVEECQAVGNMDDVGQDGWAPLYDPAEFNNEHQPLTLDGYRL